ncbi:hypothetical protein HS088_TW10G00105 [Tripterygium wilfordii]|uniref:Ribosomal protein S21 family protein n=1 Tax=Tripterygium wilfordii TaxID=458696 RepID=A0A7J7D445_TRIWF|nr:hypothetical protein HS088_TW10G00105 [Tripterygium wilfordii]
MTLSINVNKIPNYSQTKTSDTGDELNSEANGRQIQQWRGIRVKVMNGNLEQALRFMDGNMKSGGIERMIKRVETRHIKNSEKRILAQKNLQRRLQSQELSRKLKSILIRKVSYLDDFRNSTYECSIILG